MSTTERKALRDRIHQAFDLFEAGVSMKRAQFHREHPDADEAEIDALLREWLQTRPGAEHGDAPGRVRFLEPEPE